MSYRLAEAANRLEGQPMFKLLSKIKEMERNGKNVIHFEIGDPDFDTPENVKNAAIHAIKAGNVHYADSMGTHRFREIVQNNNKVSRGFIPDINQILVVPGANSAIYMAVRCLVNPGDDVIISDPCFPTYTSVMSFCGVNAIKVPLREENGFRLNVDELESKITNKTRLIIVNSPNNPTGSVCYPEELERIYEICEKHDIYLLSDEVYSRMNYGEIPFFSPSTLDLCKKRVIVLNGFSKTFAMTGWRLGVVIGPPDVIEKMGLTVQTIVSCVSPFIQEAGVEAISGNQETVNTMMKTYKARRDCMVSMLNDIPGITCQNPGGAFYCFPNISKTNMTSKDFADFALSAGIALLPGTDFGDMGEGFVRLCYANSLANIKTGLLQLKNAVIEKEV